MNIIALPVLIPLATGALLLLIKRPSSRAYFAAFASLATLLISVMIAARTFGGEVLVLQMGGWQAPYGISLVADGLTGLMLLLANVTALLTVLFTSSSLQHAPRRGRSALLNQARERFGNHALLQFLFMGVNMSFLTGDLFNLFVAFEVMLIASYGLLLIGGELAQLREGFKYVVINLLISAIFVIAAGLAYGLFGSLNMADIALRVQAHGPDARITMLVTLLALVFAAKAAVFPLGFWLANSYPAPPAATSAFFAALLTKVGVYALIRLFTLMFPAEAAVQWTMLGLAGVTMLFGALGALSQQRWRHLLAFASIASVGYVLMGVFATSTAALAAALYYFSHSVLVIFALFLLAALAETIAGESFYHEGHLSRYPWLGVAFFVLALALAGLPPTSGFIGKFALVRTLFERGGVLAFSVGGVAVGTGFLLLYALLKIWRHFFWGEGDAVHAVTLPRAMVKVSAVSLTLVILLAVLAHPIYGLTQGIAEQLVSNAAYISGVLPEIAVQGGR